MQVYLVGDPVQLPATVISGKAVQAGYNTSLFKRLQSAGFPVSMLDTQVRRTVMSGQPALAQTCQSSRQHCRLHISSCLCMDVRDGLTGLLVKV